MRETLQVGSVIFHAAIPIIDTRCQKPLNRTNSVRKGEMPRITGVHVVKRKASYPDSPMYHKGNQKIVGPSDVNMVQK